MKSIFHSIQTSLSILLYHNQDISKFVYSEFTKEKVTELMKKDKMVIDKDRDYIKELNKNGFKLTDIGKRWLKKQPKLLCAVHNQYMFEIEQLKFLDNIKLSNFFFCKFAHCF
jgi:hypothetical protein